MARKTIDLYVVECDDQRSPDCFREFRIPSDRAEFPEEAAHRAQGLDWATGSSEDVCPNCRIFRVLGNDSPRRTSPPA